MSATSQAPPRGFVRPRYDDGSFDEPLPLGDHFVDVFLGPQGDQPNQLLLTGPRGSGLTTTLRWLVGLCVERVEGSQRRRVPVLPADLCDDPPEALHRLLSGEGILFLDLSVTPRITANHRLAQGFMSDGLFAHPGSVEILRACDMVVVANRNPRNVPEEDRAPDLAQGCEWAGTLPHLRRARLASWTSDDLLELLGSSEAYRAARARLFAGLREVRHAEQMLARPRTARWLVEAALALTEDEPVTLARLYANVLDTLSPWSLGVLRRMRQDCLRTPLLQQVFRDLPEDMDEALTLFEATQALTARVGDLTALMSPEQREAHLTADDSFVRFESAPLALPGLHDFLQAGSCLGQVSQGLVPERIDPRWFPFMRELVAPAHKRVLSLWLTREGQRARGESTAATLLWATGETPALDTRAMGRSLDLSEAWLPGVSLPGARLGDANLRLANLTGARLEGADLKNADLASVVGLGIRLDGANLHGARIIQGWLQRSSLRGANLEKAVIEFTTLLVACLQGAKLSGAKLGQVDLTRADLTRADLSGASLRDCKVRGLLLAGANLRGATLHKLDLRGVRFDVETILTGLALRECYMDSVCLDASPLAESAFDLCHLSNATFRGADLRGAGFRSCRMHEVIFDDADLRGAVFEGVTFQAGSSREGLLLGKPALEGNMSGYYNEGLCDDAWASPESLRQASFRGADLRGAKFHSADLFRVDLRGAIMSDEGRGQARKAGAILDEG